MESGMLVAGKYRLVQPIGEGGMGSVWRATHEVTERDVAVKFLSSLHAEAPALLRRFLREAKMAGRLKHPGLIEVFDAGVDDEIADGPYLVMELLDGVPLDQALRRAGRLPVGLSLEIVHGVAGAMVEVHDKGIVHRDLKPANVFLHRPGTGAMVTKVLDFGIGKLPSTESPDSIRTLTRSGVIVGSPRYMSPEQAAGDTTIDARSDIHAMGVMLWECIAGRPLFDSLNPTSLAAQVLAATRPRLDEVLPDVPTSVADLVADSLAIERNARPPSASAFVDWIEQAMDAMGHRSVLAGRDGTARFMALLGPDIPALTGGTSLLSGDDSHGTEHSAPPVELSDSAVLAPTVPSGEKGGSGVRPITPSGQAPSSAAPAPAPAPASAKATWKKVAIVAAVLCVGAVAGVGASRVLAPPPVAPSTAKSATDAAASAAASAPAGAPSASAADSVAAVASSAPPVASSAPAVAPARIASPAPRATSRPSRTAGAGTKTPPPEPSTKKDPSVHHGITESGL